MLRIDTLSKTYKDGTRALREVSLDVRPGILGLLGPNGAGKSTLMKILATLLVPDSGSATIGGVSLTTDQDRGRRLLGYLPQEFGFHPTLTAEQTLEYFARLKGMKDGRTRRASVARLLELVNLSDARARRVGTFSGGMRQRLGIAQALIDDPTLLIVDEPTAGLDPAERVRFHTLLSTAARSGAVVIFSTHVVSDAAGLCDEMAIISHGQLVASTTPSAALNALNGAIWEGEVQREHVAAVSSRFTTIAAHPTAAGDRARMRVVKRGGPPSEAFTIATPTLEDYYFEALTKTPVQRAL